MLPVRSLRRLPDLSITVVQWQMKVLTRADTSTTAARIKKSTKTNQIKFKVRCHRYLYSLTLKDADKADKLKQSLPPGKLGNVPSRNQRELVILTSEGLMISDVPKKNKKGKRTA